MRSNQLAGEHQLGRRHKLDWAATSSAVTRDEPDRSEFVCALERTTPNGPESSLWLNTGNQGAVRTFSTLDETERRRTRRTTSSRSRGVNREQSVKVGGLYRGTDRDADSRAFSISAAGAPLSFRELPPEQLFDGRFSQGASTVFDIAPLGQGGSYDARDRLSAGYAMTEIGITDRVRFIGGARFERDNVRVNAVSTLGAPVATDKSWTDVLPSRSAERQAHGAHRACVCRCPARSLAPSTASSSPIASRDVIGGDNVEGDPNLERTRISNADLRWEWYPNAGEVVSVARVRQAVRQADRARVSARRQRHAHCVLSECRRRRQLRRRARAAEEHGLRRARARAAHRLHERHGDGEQDRARRRRRRARRTRIVAMVGQAPYVINAGLTYAPLRGSTSATLLFNRVGERIDAAGDQPLPDVIEQARTALDFSLRFPSVSSLSGRFDAQEPARRSVQDRAGHRHARIVSHRPRASSSDSSGDPERQPRAMSASADGTP